MKDKKIEKLAEIIYKSADCNGTLCQDCEYHKKGKFGKTNCQTIKIATVLVKQFGVEIGGKQ